MIRALVVMLAMLGAEALACSCSTPTSVFPPSGARVPLNAVFQLTAPTFGAETPRLFVGNVELALRVRTNSASWLSVQALQPLPPNTELTLVVPDARFGVTSVTYTTTDTTDDAPPATRALRSVSRTYNSNAGSTCGPSESVTMLLDGDDEADTGFLIVTGSDTATAAAESAFVRRPLLVDMACARDFPLRDTPDLAVGVRVVDFAGNVSELSEVRQAKTAGCASAPTLGVLLAALLLRRRRC
jgi:hypothetical protein